MHMSCTYYGRSLFMKSACVSISCLKIDHLPPFSFPTPHTVNSCFIMLEPAVSRLQVMKCHVCKESKNSTVWCYFPPFRHIVTDKTCWIRGAAALQEPGDAWELLSGVSRYYSLRLRTQTRNVHAREAVFVYMAACMECKCVVL